MSRVTELTKKVMLFENTYVRINIPKWLKESEKWSENRIADNGDKSKEVYQLRYMLNKICPNLHHFCPKPTAENMRGLSPEQRNQMISNYDRENTQVGLQDSDGKVIQVGVKYTEEEYEKMLSILKPALDYPEDVLNIREQGYCSMKDVTDLYKLAFSRKYGRMETEYRSMQYELNLKELTDKLRTRDDVVKVGEGKGTRYYLPIFGLHNTIRDSIR